MLSSTLRIASRRAVVGRRFAAVRAASTWANVPQGPPVRCTLTASAAPELSAALLRLLCDGHR